MTLKMAVFAPMPEAEREDGQQCERAVLRERPRGEAKIEPEFVEHGGSGASCR